MTEEKYFTGNKLHILAISFAVCAIFNHIHKLEQPSNKGGGIRAKRWAGHQRS
jgi:hypothetical protein